MGIPGTMSKGGQRIIGVDEIMLKTRCNPLLRSINLIKKLKSPTLRIKYYLELAPYFYARAQRDAQAPLSPSQSVQRAEQAAKLLTALENNIKKNKKSIIEDLKQYGPEGMNAPKEERDEIRPLSGPTEGIETGPGGSDSVGLGNGQTEVQIEGTSSESL